MTFLRVSYPQDDRERLGLWRVAIDGVKKRKKFKTKREADRWANAASGYRAVIYREEA